VLVPGRLIQSSLRKAGDYPNEAPYPTNIRLGWKTLSGTNTLAYFEVGLNPPTGIEKKPEQSALTFKVLVYMLLVFNFE
jgi:hypothetical protein